MEMEQRGCIIQFYHKENYGYTIGGTEMIKTKPFSISKFILQKAYERVKQNRGSAGADGLSLEKFEEDRRNHLYRLWNRMSSGSYMPSAVLQVEIPKKGGGARPLGIPTVTDRIAQMVVTLSLEPELDRIFHKDSYGYRPNKSAKEAVGITRQRCWKYDWVLDLDIKGFFDNIPHDLLMKAVRKHTSCKWILLYIERWLKTPVEKSDGTLAERTKGTPQGAVISPLLANLFLHYCMDEWLRIKYPDCRFERYADDCVVHCRTEAKAMELKKEMEQRLKTCGLELHPEKTKIVYCGKESRNKSYPVIAFDFLGYTFRRRKAKTKQGDYFPSFQPAISNKAKVAIRDKMRSWQLHRKGGSDLKRLASIINPALRGWINYYGAFYKSELYKVLRHMNKLLVKWATRKYKRLRNRKVKAIKWMAEISKRNPNLFAHWRYGVLPLVE
jgi:RNA-directed DNA polymerase